MKMELLNIRKQGSQACWFYSRLKYVIQTVLLLALASPALAQHLLDSFVAPAKEELEMTSLPGYPGAAAVVLHREDITWDDLNVDQHYNRIKILTEEGKRYADVDLGFSSSRTDVVNRSWTTDDKLLNSIAGRTIHPDGTIIPFTGKPYLKIIKKYKANSIEQKEQELIFTLPGVEIGSIIEYRYSTRINSYTYEPPYWYIQGNLYIKSAHYLWYPTSKFIHNNEGVTIKDVAWFPILPPGVQVEHRNLPGIATPGMPALPQVYELTINDVPPLVREAYMPPMDSLSYRVLFSYTPYDSGEEYWKDAGKEWSKRANKFIGPNSALKAATAAIVAGATTNEEKLRKIYAEVMTLENTDYTRAYKRPEDKAAGVGSVDNAADILSLRRGNSKELTELFVGMARAAVGEAHVMEVPDRSKRLFTPKWLNIDQFDNMVAIVRIDGKDQYFDPGARYCPYGQLAWENTSVEGLRQTPGGTEFARTPSEVYTANKTTRAVNLTIDEHGDVAGTVNISFTGSPALNWREQALRGDDEGLRNALRLDMEARLPKTLEVRVTEIKNLEEYEQPLIVNYEIKGPLGRPSGKRLTIPADVLEAQSRATFPDEKREQAVYFHYPQVVLDALRINFPKNLTVEASPASAKYTFTNLGVYNIAVTPATDNVTVKRNFAFNDIIVLPKDYSALRNFYSQFETGDRESVVLRSTPDDATANPAPGGK